MNFEHNSCFWFSPFSSILAAYASESNYCTSYQEIFSPLKQTHSTLLWKCYPIYLKISWKLPNHLPQFFLVSHLSDVELKLDGALLSICWELTEYNFLLLWMKQAAHLYVQFILCVGIIHKAFIKNSCNIFTKFEIFIPFLVFQLFFVISIKFLYTTISSNEDPKRPFTQPFSPSHLRGGQILCANMQVKLIVSLAQLLMFELTWHKLINCIASCPSASWSISCT